MLDGEEADFSYAFMLVVVSQESFVKLMIKIPSLYPWLLAGNHRCHGRY
jgi:hypothetical protein